MLSVLSGLKDVHLTYKSSNRTQFYSRTYSSKSLIHFEYDVDWFVYYIRSTIRRVVDLMKSS